METEKEKSKKHLSKVFFYTFIFFLLFFSLFFLRIATANAAPLLVDDFESYSIGSLTPQSSWELSFGTDPEINITNSIIGNKSLTNGSATGHVRHEVNAPSAGDTFSYFIYQDDDSASSGSTIAGTIFRTTTGGTGTLLNVCNLTSSTYRIRIGSSCAAGTILADLNKRQWYEVVIEFTGTNGNHIISVDENISNEINFASIPSHLGFSFQTPTRPFFVDGIGSSLFSNTQTRINWISPPPDTETRTFDVTLEYYLDSSDSDASKWTDILINTTARSYLGDQAIKHPAGLSLEFDTLKQEVIEITVDRDGYHFGMANFWNGVLETQDCAWWNLLCKLSEPEVPAVGKGGFSNFNVATTTIAADVPNWILDGDFCGEFSNIVSTGICNVLVFLFIPSEQSIQNFYSLQNDLSTKIPFGFFFLVKEKIGTIGEDSEGGDYNINLGEDSLGEIQIFSFSSAKETFDSLGFNHDDIQKYFRWFLWLMFSFYIFIRIQNKTTST